MKMKIPVYIVLMFFIPFFVKAQFAVHEKIMSFEGKLPDYISTKKSEVALSPKHYKDGGNSLRWKYKPNGQLILKKDLYFEHKDPTGQDTYLSTFIVWIYSEKPEEKEINFLFMKDGKECASFPFKINFKGWRAAWVCYERDMQGLPEEGMNEMRVIAPDINGVLYFDQLITSTKTDHRHQTPDKQVPFVNLKSKSQWLSLLKFSVLQPDIESEPFTTEQADDIVAVEERFRNLIFTPSIFREEELSRIKDEYGWYNIFLKEREISGRPIFFGRAAEAYERIIPNWNNNMITENGVELRKIFDLMMRVAIGFNNATSDAHKSDLEKIFVNLYLHAQDQGVADGSGLGNITHYGYSFRSFYTSCYLMKDVLRNRGLLEDAQNAMQWYGMTNEVFFKPEMRGMDMDAFNTTTTGRIASILIMENSSRKVQYLKSFSRWIDNGCLPAPGLAGSFKSDGSAFHHCNNYPAYAIGGLNGATNMIYLLSNTSFSVSPLAHQTVKDVLLAMRFYCNKIHIPLSMSGRHPEGNGQLTPVHYATMALAGAPDKKQKTDEQMAAAYLRLILPKEKTTLKEKEYLSLFGSQNILPESDPEGNISLGYSCVSIHRRNNWSVVARGHSRYLWAAEHYIGANLYGRYLAHGSLQIMTGKKGEIVTPSTSGWMQDGFDWTRIPGTTAIKLPLDQLIANVLNVDTYSGYEEMLYSDEVFAGSISQQGKNGAFGMKLHEHDKYNGSHRARKSYHLFDNRIICLGTDIENTNSRFNTETTLFQLAVQNEEEKAYWNNYSCQKNYWLDHLGIAYYLPLEDDMKKIKFEKNFPQYSKKQNTGEDTSADWISLVMDHGKAPNRESYEYMIVMQTDDRQMESYVNNPVYKVLQKDRNAHIVKDLQTNTISYILFESPSYLPETPVLTVDTACMILFSESDKKAVLTVSNPDLALYRGKADEIYDKNGKRMERSIYSRPWIFDESKDVPVTVTLKGCWKIQDTDDYKVIFSDEDKTIIRINCREGKSYDIAMS